MAVQLSLFYLYKRRAMNKLICNSCFNFEFFETNIEYLREIKVKDGSLVINDTHFEDWNYTDTHFRDSLEDIVSYVVKSEMDALSWNSEKECHENSYIKCAKCGSSQVSIPSYMIKKKKHQSLEAELKENHQEYNNLRRKRNGNTLPVLWEPK
ncbi:MAG: hypothetical protein H8E85_00630 [Candidatus Marinimicrobia bacterium]|nr:hypothetical protein [Candidatus Neomarinimicrobiota bacterium]